MNGDTQEELLRQNNDHPRRTIIDEKNYKAKPTTYQHKRKPNKKN